MKGAILIFCLIFCNVYLLLSKDLLFHDIDFGDVPVGNDSIPNIKMLSFIITNISDKRVLIEHMVESDHYPHEIAIKGNKIGFSPGPILRYFNGPLEIGVNSEVRMNAYYQSNFLDDISLSGSKLGKTVYIYYRFEDEEFYFEDSVKFYARSVPSNGIESFGFKYSFYACENDSKFISDDFSVTVLNTSEYDLKIDSVQVSIEGKNIKENNLTDKYGNISNLLPINGLLRYKFDYNFMNFEKSVGRVKFFSSDVAGLGKTFTTIDSTIVHLDVSQSDGKLYLVNRRITLYQGEKVIIPLRLLSCNNQDYFVDTIYISEDGLPESYRILPPNDKFPIRINSDSIYYVDIEIDSDISFVREKKLCAIFRNSNGDLYERCLDILIAVLSPSGVNENEIIDKPFLIYPRPASDVIRIKSLSERIQQIDLVQLYDLFGNIVFRGNSEFTELSIPVNNLSNGMYFLQIIAQGQAYNFKIPINR